MAQSHNLTITLSEEAAQFIRNKVSSGEFASESDVINESLEILKQRTEERQQWEQDILTPAHDALLERWIQEVGGPRYDNFHENPSSGTPADQVEKILEERRQQRASTRG